MSEWINELVELRQNGLLKEISSKCYCIIMYRINYKH